MNFPELRALLATQMFWKLEVLYHLANESQAPLVPEDFHRVE